MNHGAQDISLFSLAIGFLALLIPILILYHYKIKIIKDLAISLLRMTLQLSLVGVYLEVIFKINNLWINLVWIIAMILVTAWTSVKRVKLNFKNYIFPVTLAILISLTLTNIFFIGTIIRPAYLFDARYLIPISGMILGNSLNHNIVGLSTYLDAFRTKKELYYFILTNSGNRQLAIQPFIKESIIRALNPLIAGMSVMGLISLPGMMTGQILGGSSPATAIKYQIMIMIAIFTGCFFSLLLSIIFANKKLFDKYGNLSYY
jgi:putative ABC transport system permease protein